MAVIEVVPELGAWTQAWDDLAARQTPACPGLRSYWLSAWATPATRYVLVTEDGVLLGGMALVSGRYCGLPQLRPATAGLSVNFDVIAEPDRGVDVIDTLRGWIVRRRIAVVHAAALPESARFPDLLTGWRVLEPIGFSYSSPLPASLEEYLGERPRKFRNEIARMLRRFDEKNVRYRELDVHEVPEGIAELRRLQGLRFDDPRLLGRDYGVLAAALGAGVARGEANVCGLWEGDRAVIVATNFEINGVVYGVEIARDPTPEWSNAGNVFLARVVESACARGLRVFDFGPGDSLYKNRWATEKHALYSLRSALPASMSRPTLELTDLVVRARTRIRECLDRRGRRRVPGPCRS